MKEDSRKDTNAVSRAEILNSYNFRESIDRFFFSKTDTAPFSIKNYVHVPYIPALHSPGWLLRYIIGPHDTALITNIVNDVGAGITVAVTLIPAALSYSGMANVPPIVGLYSVIIPSIVYIFLGTCMPLAVGPNAIVCLLIGQFVNSYDVIPGSTDSVSIVCYGSLACGLITGFMGFLRIGRFIQFISLPVLSGFTTAAAMLIGLSQLKNAFGFNGSEECHVPYQGQKGFSFNYNVLDWWVHNLGKTDKNGYTCLNPIATQISFSVYFTCMLCYFVKNFLKRRTANKTIQALKKVEKKHRKREVTFCRYLEAFFYINEISHCLKRAEDKIFNTCVNLGNYVCTKNTVATELQIRE